MGITINVNNLSLCHKGSGGISQATLPDVCKTPPEPLPIPYPNISFSKDLAKGSTTVFADGGNSIATKPSEFSTSIGDEPGMAGGVVSGVNMKESTWITYSFDVFIDGENACRLTDKKFQNHKNTVDMGGLIQAPLTTAELRAELCPIICACAGRGNEACVAATLRALNDPSTLVEAPYQMSPTPPYMTPILSSTGRTTYPGGPTAPASFPTWVDIAGGAPGTVTIVDVVKLSDPTRTGTFDNVRSFVEIKFRGDDLTPNQRRAQQILQQNGHGDKYVVIKEEDCRCNQPGDDPIRVPAPDPGWVSLLLALLLLLLSRGRMPGRVPGGLRPAPGFSTSLSPTFVSPGSPVFVTPGPAPWLQPGPTPLFGTGVTPGGSIPLVPPSFGVPLQPGSGGLKLDGFTVDPFSGLAA